MGEKRQRLMRAGGGEVIVSGMSESSRGGVIAAGTLLYAIRGPREYSSIVSSHMSSKRVKYGKAVIFATAEGAHSCTSQVWRAGKDESDKFWVPSWLHHGSEVSVNISKKRMESYCKDRGKH